VEASGGRIDIGRIIGEAFRVYRENAGPLLGGAAVVIGLAAIVSGLLATTGSLILALIGLVVTVTADVLYIGYVVKLVQDVRDGRRDFAVGDLFRAAVPFIGVLFLNGLIFGISVGIGLILLIIPGLFLLTIWSVAPPSIVVERRGAIEAFGRSRELVRGEGWSVFGVIIVTFLIVFGISFVAGAIGAAAGDAGRVIVQVIANVILAPIYALVSSILFFELGGGVGAPTAPATLSGTAPEPGGAPAETPPQAPPPPENPPPPAA